MIHRPDLGLKAHNWIVNGKWIFFVFVCGHARCLFGECICVLMSEGMSSTQDGIPQALSIL